MSLCEYETVQTTEDHFPLFKNTDCVDVGVNWYAYSSELGILTYGAGPCMVVIVHDIARNTGALAHINVCLTANQSFDYADKVINHMIESVQGKNLKYVNLQILLFQGRSHYSNGYYNHISNHDVLSNCRIENYLNNGIGDYLYYPKGNILYPITRNEIHWSLKKRPMSGLNYPDRGWFASQHYLVNVHNLWSDINS
jgi:hypothetical protein